MKFYTYIIQSEIDKSYYIRSTADLQKRIERHNLGMSISTKRRVPWKLVYYEVFPTKSEAIKKENYLKRQKSRKYIESLISLGKT